MDKFPIDNYIDFCKLRASFLKAVYTCDTYFLNKYYKRKFEGLSTKAEEL